MYSPVIHGLGIEIVDAQLTNILVQRVASNYSELTQIRRGSFWIPKSDANHWGQSVTAQVSLLWLGGFSLFQHTKVNWAKWKLCNQTCFNWNIFCLTWISWFLQNSKWSSSFSSFTLAANWTLQVKSPHWVKWQKLWHDISLPMRTEWLFCFSTRMWCRSTVRCRRFRKTDPIQRL